MAAPRSTWLFPLLRQPTCQSCIRRQALSGSRLSSTEASPTSALLTKIKNDLKTAMRAKDTARGTISAINQAASSSTPIASDMQILALLRKRRSSTEDAKKEADAAERPDLADKQEKELQVIDSLVGTVPMMDNKEMRYIVRSKVEFLRHQAGGEVKQGMVMKELLKTGGDLEGKVYENKVLAELVREECMSDHSKS